MLIINSIYKSGFLFFLISIKLNFIANYYIFLNKKNKYKQNLIENGYILSEDESDCN